MSATVRQRLLEELGIEPYVLRGTASNEPIDLAGKALAIACGKEAGNLFESRYAPLVRHLLATLKLEAARVLVVAKPNVDLPTICFGTEPGDRADAILAPPLAALRQSPAAKRALWKSIRGLVRALRTATDGAR